MNPPPLPSETKPANKKFGCARWILLLGLACTLLLVALAVLGAVLSNGLKSDTPLSASQAPEKPDAMIAATANSESSQDVPENVVSLAKGELGDRYKDSGVMADGEVWTIWIRANADAKAEHPQLLQQEMVRLASLCHPQGMKVGKFSVIYDDDFTDGLGNTKSGKLLQCRMIEGVSERINWGNRRDDLYALNFSRIFTTEFCHPSYKNEWNAALEK